MTHQVVVDVSEHNSPIDWSAMRAAGVTHAYIRATRGVRHVDRALFQNTYGAANQGIVFGLYHYFMHHIDGARQADWFLHVVNCNFGGLPPVLDVEGAFQVKDPDPRQLYTWLEQVEKVAGQPPAIYTSAGYWNPTKMGHPVAWANDYPLWVAHWTGAQKPLLPRDWSDYWLWQYGHEEGRRFGVVSELIDMNRFQEQENDKFDMLDYLAGDGRIYRIRGSHGDEVLRTEWQDGQFYQVKNNHWEQLWPTDDYIYRGIDTSPGNGRYYGHQTNGKLGAPWIPRHMRIGQKLKTKKWVQFYWTENCQPSDQNSGNVTDTIQLIQHHPYYRTRHGYEVEDVLELLWCEGGERYFYGRGYGLIGWQNAAGSRWSQIVELCDERHDMEIIPCLGA